MSWVRKGCKRFPYTKREGAVLGVWGRDIMVILLQPAFSNSLYWKKIIFVLMSLIDNTPWVQRSVICELLSMGLLPDRGFRMRRECRERFPHHQLKRKPLVSDPGMHHGTCVSHARAVMHVEIANPRWRGKRSRHSRCMRKPQSYVSGKRPMNHKPSFKIKLSSYQYR